MPVQRVRRLSADKAMAREETARLGIISQRLEAKRGQALFASPGPGFAEQAFAHTLTAPDAIDLDAAHFSRIAVAGAGDVARDLAIDPGQRQHPCRAGHREGAVEGIGPARRVKGEIATGKPCRIERRDPFDRDAGTQPSAAIFSSASRSSWARLFFSAAVLSWPQAASMSRPRGVRTGAEMPASKMMFEKARTRSGVEVS